MYSTTDTFVELRWLAERRVIVIIKDNIALWKIPVSFVVSAKVLETTH